MAKWDRFVYSYVPKKAVATVLEEGLYGGEALLKRTDLLEIVAKDRKISPAKFKHKIEKDLKDPFWRSAAQGPNIVFQLIPDMDLVSKKHPVRVRKLVPIKINLTELLSDYPETKVFGMELKPYEEGMPDRERHHYLSNKELNKFMAMSGKKLWSLYNDIDDKGLYAADVPHASIHTASGIILPQYLKQVKRAEIIDDIVKLAEVFERYSGIL